MLIEELEEKKDSTQKSSRTADILSPCSLDNDILVNNNKIFEVKDTDSSKVSISKIQSLFDNEKLETSEILIESETPKEKEKFKRIK